MWRWATGGRFCTTPIGNCACSTARHAGQVLVTHAPDSSNGATSLSPDDEKGRPTPSGAAYAAPTGLGICLWPDSTKISLLTELRPTPTELNHSARRWPMQSGYAGSAHKMEINPERVESNGCDGDASAVRCDISVAVRSIKIKSSVGAASSGGRMEYAAPDGAGKCFGMRFLQRFRPGWGWEPRAGGAGTGRGRGGFFLIKFFAGAKSNL